MLTEEALDLSLDFCTRFYSSQDMSEFDKFARIRMINGARELSPYIEKYFSKNHSVAYEFGPYFYPLVTINKAKSVVYIDGEKEALSHLNEKYKNISGVHCFHKNLNGPRSKLLESIEYVSKKSDSTPSEIVISQLLNYLDFKQFLHAISDFALPNTKIYINNVIDYGIESLFSPLRPKNDDEIIYQLTQANWTILENKKIKSKYHEQKNSRLVVVAEKHEK